VKAYRHKSFIISLERCKLVAKNVVEKISKTKIFLWKILINNKKTLHLTIVGANAEKKISMQVEPDSHLSLIDKYDDITLEHIVF